MRHGWLGLAWLGLAWPGLAWLVTQLGYAMLGGWAILICAAVSSTSHRSCIILAVQACHMWREKKKKQLTNCHVQLSPALITEPDQKATTELWPEMR